MKMKTLAPALLALACLAAAPAADTPDWFKKLDRNGDGKITRDEMPKIFDQLDANQDGIASINEVTDYYSKLKGKAAKVPTAEPKSITPKAAAKAAAEPAEVEKRAVIVWSDGTRMAADLYLPKSRRPEEKLPALVLCAGTGGTKGGTQARIAPIFARAGYVVLAFDYRGWGESESQLMAVGPQPKPDANNEMTLKVKALRWQMNYTDQTEDIRAAISFLAGEPAVDKDRIGLWGSSYGGGLVTTMAALDARVKCVAAQVPGLAARTPRALAGALDLHTKQARGETEPVPIETGKMTGKMERYSNMRVNPAKSLGFNSAEASERITSPILFVVAENEELSNNVNVEAVQKALLARGVPSAYHVIKGITHYGVYREGFDEATRIELEWFAKHLKAAAPASAPAPKAAPKALPPAKQPEAKTAPVGPASATAALAHFENKIRPVLVAKCYECHSAEAKKTKGGLALDTRAGIRRGGDSGPAVVPGDAKASLLLAAIRHEQDLEMPPKEKLTDAQIADFARWIADGAPDPREGVSVPALDLAKAREFWSFKPPVKPPVPAVASSDWPVTDVDRFVLAAQREHGVKVAPDAAPRTLVRRLYFDLHGLPPTPEEVESFVRDWSSNPKRALESTVDRLLASPRFGERWGRHWLDVARYAESSGKETSFSYPQAWRYRDYVIASFNADKPFDQFIREQLAGDFLPANDAARRAELTIATGFLALGPKSHIERNKLQFEMDLVDEQIDATTQAFLGMTVACARCHDHKFDPVPQADYYALAGIFRSTETLYGTIPLIQNHNPATLAPLPANAKLPAGVKPLDNAERAKLAAQITELREERRAMTKAKKPGTSEFLRNGILLNTLEGRLAAFEADGAPKLLAMAVRDRDRAQDSPLYLRGEIEKPAASVPRGFVQVLCRDAKPVVRAGSGRRELAEWIAARENPLTARVFVNRVWLNLFGRGLVTTPDNFGMSGQPPSHPALLDHLAVSFMDNGWSVKRLVRELVLSRAYRLDSAPDAANLDKDPENIWLWRMSPRRLDAESIRDAMLAIAGRLDLTPPVGSVVAQGGEGYTGGIERGAMLAEEKFNHRSVYLPVIRGRAFESMDVFDGVDGSAVTGQRDQTTVPAQSLYLLNSPFTLGLASTAAARLLKDTDNPEARVELAYQRCFGRAATVSERQSALAFIGRYREQAPPATPARRNATPELAAWTAFAQSLWASGEFLGRK